MSGEKGPGAAVVLAVGLLVLVVHNTIRLEIKVILFVVLNSLRLAGRFGNYWYCQQCELGVITS